MGGAESLGISMESYNMLPRLMKSQIWYQLANSVRGRFRKATMASVFFHPDISVSPYMPPMPFKLLPHAGVLRE